MPRPRILIIDPSQETRAMYAEYFRYHDYDVVEAEDGAEAVRLCEAGRPDLIVAELSDEPEWLRSLRTLRGPGLGGATAMIICSTRLDPAWPELPLHVDADLALSKPILPGTLLLEIESLLTCRPPPGAESPAGHSPPSLTM